MVTICIIAKFGLLNLERIASKQFLVSVSLDKTIKIWDLKSNQCIKTLDGHTERVNCLEVLSNNQFASGSADKSIKNMGFK